MSNTVKKWKTKRSDGYFRRIRHKSQLVRFKMDKIKRNRRYKNPTPDEVIIEGSYSDKYPQKSQNNKDKRSKREYIRRLRKQKQRRQNQIDEI